MSVIKVPQVPHNNTYLFHDGKFIIAAKVIYSDVYKHS